MPGYRLAYYYELCRLCTSSEGMKMHIFREEGRRRQLPTKIQICLPLQVCEDDPLPKIICSQCVEKLESFYTFRESCINAEAMLESYFSSLGHSQDFEGKQCYVKDVSPTNTQQSSLQKPYDKTKASANDGLNCLVQTASIATIIDEDRSMPPSALVQSNHTTESEAETRSVGYVKQNPVAEVQCEEDDAVVQAQEYETLVQVKQTAEVGSQTCEDAVMEMQPASDAGQEMVMQFAFIIDEEGLLHATSANDPNALSSSSFAEIDDFLRLKNICPVSADGTSAARQEETSTEDIVHEEVHQCAEIFSSSGELAEQEYGGVQSDMTDNPPSPVVSTSSLTYSPPPQVATASSTSSFTYSPPPQAAIAVSSSSITDSPPPAGSISSLTATQGRIFPCETCGKRFRRKEHLAQHRILHADLRPYECRLCNKAFSRREHMCRHEFCHTRKKVHACDVCDKFFSRKDNLLKHRKTHDNMGPFVCETCGKSFILKYYYSMHCSSHADNLPYVCDICSKAFAVEQHLLTHKIRHKKFRGDRNQQIKQQQQQTIPTQQQKQQQTIPKQQQATATQQQTIPTQQQEQQVIPTQQQEQQQTIKKQQQLIPTQKQATATHRLAAEVTIQVNANKVIRVTDTQIVKQALAAVAAINHK